MALSQYREKINKHKTEFFQEISDAFKQVTTGLLPELVALIADYLWVREFPSDFATFKATLVVDTDEEKVKGLRFIACENDYGAYCVVCEAWIQGVVTYRLEAEDDDYLKRFYLCCSCVDGYVEMRGNGVLSSFLLIFGRSNKTYSITSIQECCSFDD